MRVNSWRFQGRPTAPQARQQRFKPIRPGRPLPSARGELQGIQIPSLSSQMISKGSEGGSTPTLFPDLRFSSDEL